VAGCGFGTRPLEPVVAGAQRFFTIDWETARRGTQPVVRGYIKNEWGLPAANVRLLVEGLEPPDRLVSQRLVGIGGQVMPGSPVYFETPMPPAPSYRIRVFAFDWVQASETFGR
jgi:hypothetical protein